MNYKALLMIPILSLALLFSGCLNASENNDSEQKSLNLGLPPWPGVTVKSNVVKVILEEKGYAVKLNSLDAGLVYAKLAEGELDVLLAGWLPATHENYWNQYGDQLDKVNVNVEKTALGLAVPRHTYESGIQSITDLKGNGKIFNSRIVGIEPGAGIMSNTENAIEIYGLENYELKSSSTPAMMAELERAFNRNENIIVTVWEPHSVFFRFDIVMLDDPERVYGDGDKVYTIARKGLESDDPVLYEFFKKFKITPEIQSGWIYEYSDEGRNPEDVAREWVRNNSEIVSEWTSHMN
ncbi:Substrate-binding region of ABC-type glycine betaine transport system [Methanococcus vannielii SB]|uniref:Substrate-binding region of ABC-type glycine betaine transport system n=1 Tax=Methanococcus vannielii (strain ATCC 35089 / DSM 1224 / JCM 13029 / OCM 148 / SB) TaxID=406327 RepID=A6UN96_METVS|nr:glycine betaine ABC transporter substrate-binding protein [Methanococcus vannielii]ABR53968.1 Substrate-binding region of ABC-type glycine betaine transport system [Methanococcus vannielii SB]